MRLIGKENIRGFGGDGASQQWLAYWISELTHAHWKRPSDVWDQFPRCKQRADGSFAFPVREGPHAIVAIFHFSLGIALIQGTAQIDQL